MTVAFDLVNKQWQRKLIVLALVVVGVFLVAASEPVFPENSLWHETVERSGILCILIGILGRTWCSMYIGGNKLSMLVTDGPYSITRNPLYLFSAIAAFGVGAQLGSIVFAMVCAATTVTIFAVVVNHEERALADRFPDEFALYRARVPRFLPKVCQYQEAEAILVRPTLVNRTFRDALLFLVAVPGIKALDTLREAGLIEPLFRLY